MWEMGWECGCGESVWECWKSGWKCKKYGNEVGGAGNQSGNLSVAVEIT